MTSLIDYLFIFVLTSLALAGDVENASVRRSEMGVRRMMKNGLVEVAAEGPIKRQSPSESGAGLTEEDNARFRCQISKGSAPALGGKKPGYGDDEFVIRSVQLGSPTASARDCALLCASEAKCKTFYHVSDSKHMLYNQCTLTSWFGHLDQFTENPCCDSGFPCSAADLLERHMDEPRTFPMKEISAPRHMGETAQGDAPKMKNATSAQDTANTTSTQNTANAAEIERLTHALDRKQTELAKKDVEIAQGKSETGRLTHAIEIRQHQMVEKDMENAQNKAEMRRLNHALDTRQRIFVEKDLQMVEEKRNENRLQAEVHSLTEELKTKVLYLYGLTAALVLTTTLLLGLAAFAVLHHLGRLPPWLASPVTLKQKAAPAQGTDSAQAIAQTNEQ